MSKQQRYTPEFKTEAVKLVLEQGIQQSLAARRLSIPEVELRPGRLGKKSFSTLSFPIWR